ncbi:hypothetical protein PoB_006070600 [Plakobranchus ocellatus]|uniref:Uncharacterized protein n=1 Tax=Plakobranchus ocellatus TaxID=259542 RepID=A0AAV4CQX2_9GAST|nr:hypothetical protein PoB_006070600 [Plakobranchus ocellatus]
MLLCGRVCSEKTLEICVPVIRDGRPGLVGAHSPAIALHHSHFTGASTFRQGHGTNIDPFHRRVLHDTQLSPVRTGRS